MSNRNTPNTRTVVITFIGAAFALGLAGCQTTPRQQTASLGDWYANETSSKSTPATPATPAQDKPVSAAGQASISPSKKKQDQTDLTATRTTPRTTPATLEKQLAIYQSARDSIESGIGSPTLTSQLDTQIIALQIQKADAQYDAAPDQPNIYTGVIANLTQWIKNNPTHASVDQYRYQLARIQALSGESTEVESTLESLRLSKANLSNKQQQEIDFRLGETAFSQGRYDKAVDYYSNVLRDQEQRSNAFALEKALYMRAWSYLQQNEFKDAANDFLVLLTSPELKTQNPQMEQDIYRGFILAINDAGGVSEIPTIVDMQAFEPISMDIYERLIDFYSEEERWSEVISAYQAYQDQYPDSENALTMATQLLSFLEEKNQKASLRDEKANFIQRYSTLAPKKAASFTLELATYHRAQALKIPKSANKTALVKKEFDQSLSYYQIYIDQFKTQSNISQVMYDFAETLLESGDTAAAKIAFNAVAQSNAPLELRQKSAYFELTSLDSEIDKALESSALELEKVTIAQNFVRDFPEHPKIKQVLNWLMVHHFKFENYPQAMTYAQKLKSTEKYGHAAYQITADSLFATQKWLEAAKAYEQVIAHAQSRSAEVSLKNTWQENRLKAYYQAARQAEPREALSLFAIIYNSNNKELAPAALYDAGLLSESNAFANPNQSIELYKRYLREYSQQPNAKDVRLKLANIYKNTEQWEPAAVLLQQAAQNISNSELQQIALLEVAELFNKAQNTPKALSAYKAYIEAAQNTGAYEDIALAKTQLIALEQKSGNPQAALALMSEFVKTDLQSPSATPKTREAAQTYAIELAQRQHATYKSIRITRNLQSSFQSKQKALEQAIARYTQLAQFDTPKAKTLADAGIGNLFSELSNALLNAPVPPGMSELEEEEYMLIIEEQAFPFEEKALDSHTKNITRLHKGDWSEGIETSLNTLRVLMPARFDKKERFEGAITHAE